jgi:tripartite-type tricarboxylate transporter receptor subunit TctC
MPQATHPVSFPPRSTTRRRLLAAAGLCGLAPGLLQAQQDRPVRMVVANPPGGPLDIVARVVAEHLAGAWKQPVVVDNRPGGNGIVAADFVARSRPDGQTLLVTATFTESIMPYAAVKLPYDAERDLVPVTEIARVPFLLVVPADSPIRSFQDFKALAASGKALSIGGLGRGSSPHMAWELVRKGAAIPPNVVYVPYQGPGPAQTDLLGGQLAVVLDTYGSARAMLEAGRLRAIAVTSRERVAQLPQVPTLHESGLAGFEIFPWIGLVAPAGTPAARIQAVQEAVAASLGQAPVKARLEQFGFTPVGNTPAAMAATVRAERLRFAPLVKELGITLD